MVASTVRVGQSLSRSLRKTGVGLPKGALFGTDGIRGKAGELLTASFALKLGLAAGEVLRRYNPNPSPIIIGQDSRNSSDMLAMAMSAGLTSSGIEVWHLGLCPTPCVAGIVKTNEALGGIMISASHNPPEDNGIKFFSSQGTKLDTLVAAEIEAVLRENYNEPSNVQPQSWGQHRHLPNLTANYTQMLADSLPAIDFRGMKIVLDLAWGASVEVAPTIFKQLGAEVICLHDRADGDRINVNCGSTYLETLQRSVCEHEADLGFAFDGDADRVMAIEPQGRVVDGDYILYLWGKNLQQRQQLPDNLIIATVMTNLGFERAWEKQGGKMTRTAVGDRYVQAEMWRTGAMLGGEQSGHILCHHHGVSGDGIQTALHLTALVRQAGVSLGELVDNSFQTYPQILRNIRVEDRDRRCQWQECEPIQRLIVKAEADLGDRGRILVRASGTEPLIRVMVEAESSDSAHHWTETLVNCVETHLGC
jgi:phosphoglucosamine mutase